MASATGVLAWPLLAVVCLATVVTAGPQDCGSPKDRGSCSTFEVQWYYDTEYGGCLRFWYGGCGGNGNRFASEADCTAQCVSPAGDALCHLPAVRGACKRAKSRWFSDPASGGCRRFTYSGCLGNDNNFETDQECEERCRAALGRPPPPDPVPQPQPSGSSAADCQLPARVAGTCAEWALRYSWLPDRQQCAAFYWGGCGGNANNFESSEQCEAICKQPTATQAPEPQDPHIAPRRGRPSYRRPTPAPSTQAPYYEEPTVAPESARPPHEGPLPARCYQPDETGECKAYFLHFYYNAERRTCLQFVYGGCGGNDNNFRTIEECESVCKADAQQPHEEHTEQPQYEHETEAPAEQEQPTEHPWYYRPSDSPPRQEPTPAPYAGPLPLQCQQPEQSGPCQGYYPMFFYSSERRRCMGFIYGGCEGNKNRFRSLEECQSACSAEVSGADEESMKEDEREDVCSLPPDQGPCRAHKPYFYYNAALQSCYTFYFGGCGGNGNRFSSAEECARRCQPASVAEPQPEYRPRQEHTTTYQPQPVYRPRPTYPPQQTTTEPPLVVTDDRQHYGYDDGEHMHGGGRDHQDMGHHGMDHHGMDSGDMDHGRMGHGDMDHGMDHAAMDHDEGTHGTTTEGYRPPPTHASSWFNPFGGAFAAESDTEADTAAPSTAAAPIYFPSEPGTEPPAYQITTSTADYHTDYEESAYDLNLSLGGVYDNSANTAAPSIDEYDPEYYDDYYDYGADEQTKRRRRRK